MGLWRRGQWRAAPRPAPRSTFERVSGPENTGKARKTRSRPAPGSGAAGRSPPRRRQRRRQRGCAEPRPSAAALAARGSGGAAPPRPAGRGGKARQGRAGRRRACSLRPAGLACLPSSCLSPLPSPGLGRRRGPGALAPARGRAALAHSSRPRRAGGQPPRWAPERGRRHRPQPTYVFFTRQIAHHACPHLAMLSETALMGGGGDSQE